MKDDWKGELLSGVSEESEELEEWDVVRYSVRGKVKMVPFRGQVVFDRTITVLRRPRGPRNAEIHVQLSLLRLEDVDHLAILA